MESEFSDIEKLKAALPHLKKHNTEHIKDMNKWIDLANQAGMDEIAADLLKIKELSQEIDSYLESAISRLDT